MKSHRVCFLSRFSTSTVGTEPGVRQQIQRSHAMAACMPCCCATVCITAPPALHVDAWMAPSADPLAVEAFLIDSITTNTS